MMCLCLQCRHSTYLLYCTALLLGCDVVRMIDSTFECYRNCILPVFLSSDFLFSPSLYSLPLYFFCYSRLLALQLISIFPPLHFVLSQYDSHSIYCLTLFLSISNSVQIKRLSKRLSIHILIEEFSRGESMNPYIAADTRPQLDAAAADELRIQANIEVSIVSNMLYCVFAFERFPFYLTSSCDTLSHHTIHCLITPHKVGMKERALKRKNRPTRTLDLEVDPEDHVTYLVYPTEENAQVCVCVCVCVCV